MRIKYHVIKGIDTYLLSESESELGEKRCGEQFHVLAFHFDVFPTLDMFFILRYFSSWSVFRPNVFFHS